MANEKKTISENPNRRPYAAGVTLILQTGTEYGLDGEVCLLTEGDFIVRLKPEKKAKAQDGVRLRRITATIEGFGAACKAEEMGLRLSLALLWCAVSTKHHLKLDYHTPQPCVVFDRTHGSSRVGSYDEVNLTLTKSLGAIDEAINQVLSKEVKCDPCLLISMELYASSELESTERAKFVSLVSSLEPLAKQESYHNAELDEAVNQFTSQVKGLSSLDGAVKDSVAGRAYELKRQSISKSIECLIANHFPGDSAVLKIVSEAYGIRSKILHEGLFDADLVAKSRQLREILRHIYSQMIDLQPQSPICIE